jgi:hypothetical protein
MILMLANLFLGPLIEEVSPENLDFFGPKWHSFSSLPFQGPESLDVQGPPLLMAVVIDLHVSKSGYGYISQRYGSGSGSGSGSFCHPSIIKKK